MGTIEITSITLITLKMHIEKNKIFGGYYGK